MYLLLIELNINANTLYRLCSQIFNFSDINHNKDICLQGDILI